MSENVVSDDQPILQKADFGVIYDQPDPRSYFNTLGDFDYAIPQEGADVFRQLLNVESADPGEVPTILDLCCSYGIVSTLIKTDLGISDVYRHYADPEVISMSSEQVRSADEQLISTRLRNKSPRIIGMDIARNAVEYAVAIGSLDAGVAEDLERDNPSPRLVDLMAEVDLITTTGGVGYVTDKTFDRLLQVAKPSTQVAAFCLRTYDYEPIARTLAGHGLVTESVTRTFRQRRFVDQDEHKWAMDQVRGRGLDPAGKEDDGYYHAEFYLSRPADTAKDNPIDELLAP